MQDIYKSYIDSIGEEKLETLIERLEEVNHLIAVRGILPFQDKAKNYDLLTGYTYGEFYDWDLYFENIYLSYFGVSRFCRVNVEAFLDRQLKCGFVARSLVNQRMRDHFKPFLAQIALLGSRQLDNFAWLEGNFYNKLKKYIDYWFWYCDFDKNGLPVWDGAGHSGMDNHYSRLGVDGSMMTEGVDLSCYLLRELRTMAIIAGELGKTDDKAEFEEHAEELTELINTVFWDEEDGFYYDRHEREGHLMKVKSIAGFIPLWLGIVPKERAERLVKEHLLNPDEFKTKFPIPCYSQSEPDYYQQRKGVECNWRGTAWVPTNYMVCHGLRTQGYEDLAQELAQNTFNMVMAEDTTREYYNAENGCGQGLYPFWGWSILAYFMPLEFEMNYDPTNLQNKNIIPIAKDAFNLQFDITNNLGLASSATTQPD
jgi:putative isomerase